MKRGDDLQHLHWQKQAVRDMSFLVAIFVAASVKGYPKEQIVHWLILFPLLAVAASFVVEAFSIQPRIKDEESDLSRDMDKDFGRFKSVVSFVVLALSLVAILENISINYLWAGSFLLGMWLGISIGKYYRVLRNKD